MTNDVRVCVVDDEPSALRLFCDVLALRGIEPECYGSGEELLSCFDPSATGCVVTDLRLPGIQGTQIQSRLRELESDLAVVVVSGAADVATAVEMMRNGAVTVLQKPFSPQTLLDAVDAAIERSRRDRQRREFTSGVRQRLDLLTIEERDVLAAMLSGKPNKIVSAELAMSSRTLDRRRQAIFEKMKVGSVAELASLVSSVEPVFVARSSVTEATTAN